MEDVKICDSCGKVVEAGTNFCPNCGNTSFHYEEKPADAAEFNAANTPPVMQAAPEQAPQSEHVLAGIGGALLFSLGGVAVYVLLYQFGFIAWLSVTATYGLASLGYALFSGNRKTKSLASWLVPIIITVIMLLVSEYVAVVVALYREYKSAGYDVALIDVARAMPEFFKDAEIRKLIWKDLAVSLVIGAIILVSNLIRMIKAKADAKKAGNG